MKMRRKIPNTHSRHANSRGSATDAGSVDTRVLNVKPILHQENQPGIVHAVEEMAVPVREEVSLHREVDPRVVVVHQDQDPARFVDTVV